MRKPKILVSKCLDFEKCRYDGQAYKNKLVQSLKEHADLIMVCPEVEIGLETPRDPIKIIFDKKTENYKLIQHNTNNDYTEDMRGFSKKYLSEIDDIDGFILKGKSPSCGLKDVKIYHEGNKCAIRKNANGMFCDEVVNTFTNCPIETDGRLTNYSNRDNFLTKIFLINELKSSNDILEFNKKNELLLKSYDKDKFNDLEILLKSDINEQVISKYRDCIYDILSNKRNRDSKLEIIQNVFDKYKNKLTKEEIDMFNETVDSFNNNKIPFSSLTLATKIFATRFKDSDTLSQSFFNPYPENLISISDSGKEI